MTARFHLSPGKFIIYRAARRFEDAPCYRLTPHISIHYRENRLTELPTSTEQIISSPGSCLTKCLAYVGTVQKYVAHAKRRESPGNDRNSVRLLARGRKGTKRRLSSRTEAGTYYGNRLAVLCRGNWLITHFIPLGQFLSIAIFRRFGPHHLFSFCHWRGTKGASGSFCSKFRFALPPEKGYGCEGRLLLG